MNRFLLPVATLWYRELVRFYRQRDRVLGTLATPLLFWAVIGSGFSGSLSSSGSYLQYLYPGTIILSLLFTAIFSTISIIEDRREGFLQSVLVAPISRASMVLGKIMGATTIAVIQGTGFLVLAPLLKIPMSATSFALSISILLIIAFGLSNLGFLIAWRSTSTQGFHAIMNLFLMPMWLLSGAFFPESGVPGWIGGLIRLNPLTYGVRSLRETMLHNSGHSLLFSLVVCLCFALFSFAGAALVAGRQSDKDLP